MSDLDDDLLALAGEGGDSSDERSSIPNKRSHDGSGPTSKKQRVR